MLPPATSHSPLPLTKVPAWTRALARHGWLVPVVLVLALWLFTLPFEFAFDDENDIIFADAVHHLIPADWAVATRRPLVTLSFALNWAWTGAEPWSYRLVNIAIHAANAALLWSVIREALKRQGSEKSPLGRSAIALACAAIWAAHPLHTSAVTYAVHRYESLAAGFMLATLSAWQRSSTSARPTKWYALAVLAACAAIVSKEVAIVTPVLIATYEFAFSPPGDARSKRRRYAWAAGLAAAAFGLAAVVYSRGPGSASQGTQTGISRLDYLNSEWEVIVYYLRLAVAPLRLSVDYFDWPVAPRFAPQIPFALVVIALVATTAWAFFKAPRAGWAGLVFFAVLAPTSTLIPLAHELVAERRMYLPLAGLVALAVVAAARALARLGGGPRTTFALAAAVTLALGALTVKRNVDFTTAESLFRHDVSVRPGNSRLHRNLAARLLLAGNKAEAFSHYERSLALEPLADVHSNMGAIAAELGWDALARSHLSLAIAQHPRDIAARVNEVTFLLSIGQDAAALASAERATAAMPTSGDLSERLAWVLATARDPAVVDGRRALGEAQHAIALDAGKKPGISRAVTLAAALAAAGNTQDALGLASMVLAQARGGQAVAWVEMLTPQVAAYAAGERWVDSGRRHRERADTDARGWGARAR